MEPDTKRGRLEELLNSEQVRQLLIYGGKEVILNLDVMEVVFLYQALPHVRNRLKRERVWNLLYNEKIVPQLLELDPNPKRLGDDDRQNCLAWAFALKMYRLQVPSETGPPSKWYVSGELFERNTESSAKINFQNMRGDYIVQFSLPYSHVHIRTQVVQVLLEETMNNPSFETSNFSAFVRMSWEVSDPFSALQQLAQVIYVFLSNGFQMVVNWHNGNYFDRPKQFIVREKLE
jgi:hypothetical protein